MFKAFTKPSSADPDKSDIAPSQTVAFAQSFAFLGGKPVFRLILELELRLGDVFAIHPDSNCFPADQAHRRDGLEVRSIRVDWPKKGSAAPPQRPRNFCRAAPAPLSVRCLACPQADAKGFLHSSFGFACWEDFCPGC